MPHFKLHLVDPETVEPEEYESDNPNGPTLDLAWFLDGHFQASYNIHTMPECAGQIESMLEQAFKAGEKHRSAEILGLLGGKS